MHAHFNLTLIMLRAEIGYIIVLMQWMGILSEPGHWTEFNEVLPDTLIMLFTLYYNAWSLLPASGIMYIQYHQLFFSHNLSLCRIGCQSVLFNTFHSSHSVLCSLLFTLLSLLLPAVRCCAESLLIFLLDCAAIAWALEGKTPCSSWRKREWERERNR